MRRSFLLAAGMGAVLAGCGGGGGQSSTKPPDSRTALDTWLTKADAACKKVNEAIAERKWPANLVDLDRLSVRAADDIREASATIQKLPPPEGAEKRITPFVDTVKRLDGLIEHVTDTTEKFKPARLTALAPKLQAGLLEVEKASKELGLRECAANQEHTWVPDAIRAPVFAQQLADLDSKLTRRANDVVKPASSREDASRKMQKLSEIVGSADRGLARLKPPTWADDEAGAYLVALRELGAALDNFSAALAQSSFTEADYNRANAKLVRAGKLERRRFKRLAREIGAIPTVPGGRGGGDDEAPAGDETQAA